MVGDHATWRSTTAGLRVIDVSVPSAPVEVGFRRLLRAVPTAWRSAGSYAYVADRGSGLRVISIANPSAPERGRLRRHPGQRRDVAVAGSYAYVADGAYGLRVISVANPSAPVEVGSVDTPGWAYGVAVAGSYAYVADFDFGLRVISIANPAMPSEVGFVDTSGYAEDVAVAGSLAFVAGRFGGLRRGRCQHSGRAESKSVSWAPEGRPGGSRPAGLAYVADDYGGLVIVDADVPSPPIAVGVPTRPPDTPSPWRRRPASPMSGSRPGRPPACG